MRWTDVNTKDARVWWKAEGHEWPLLQRHASRVFSAHVTSVDCERSFSAARRQLSELRGRMTNDRHKKITMISMNWSRREGGQRASGSYIPSESSAQTNALGLVSDVESGGDDADEEAAESGAEDVALAADSGPVSGDHGEHALHGGEVSSTTVALVTAVGEPAASARYPVSAASS